MCVNMCECVCMYGKLDLGYVLFQVLQLLLCASPARPLAPINTFCIVFPFPSKRRNIWIIVLMGICSFLFQVLLKSLLKSKLFCIN